jgi:predicted phage baseplate assembly protein
VSLLDLERLALEVPGTRVVRARAWSSLHPAYPCLTAPGVVTVVVLPELPRGRPEPSPGLIAAVRCFLERRRMVATRLEVVGPRYLEVGVIADVRTKALVDAARVRDDILTALDAFLDPLTGGPAGLGWPFGRSVFRSEVLQLIDGVQGVDHVLSLRLIAADAEPSCGNLNLCPTWLVAPVEHRIRVNPAADVLPDTGPIRPVCPPEPAGDSPS